MDFQQRIRNTIGAVDEACTLHPCCPIHSPRRSQRKRRRETRSSSFLLMMTFAVVLALATQAAAFVPLAHHRLQPPFVLQAATSTREATSRQAASRTRKLKPARNETNYSMKEDDNSRRNGVETFTLDMLGNLGGGTPSRTRSKYRPAGARGVRAAMTKQTRKDYEAEIGVSQVSELAKRLASHGQRLDLDSLPKSVLDSMKAQGIIPSGDADVAFPETQTYANRQARAEKERKKTRAMQKSGVTREEIEEDASGSDISHTVASLESDFMVSNSGILNMGKRNKSAKMVRNVNEKTWASYKRELRSVTRAKPNAEFDYYAYYKSELLTAQEEYELGMKVQFLAGCEDVHEGLCLALSRLPTISEWAVACGFNETDAGFVESADDQHMRPPGWEDRFKVVNPDWFEGRGRVSELGVGRGKAKKDVPRRSLPDYFDDSEDRFREPGSPKVKAGPINRGTIKTFFELLSEAREAKDTMIRCNMRLVVSIAKKFTKAGVSVGDLVQDGSVGLATATMKFKPKKGFRFSTYASWWIQQAVYNAITRDSRTIRLPAHIHNALNRVRKVRKELEVYHGRKPTNGEIAEKLKMTEEKYVEMMKRTRRCISLDAPRYKNNKSFDGESVMRVGDVIPCEEHSAANTVRAIDRNIFMEDLKGMMEELTADERAVIGARYGLVTGTARSVTAVAALMKQTNSWVRNQELKGLRKLRRPWYEKRLKEHQAAIAR